MPDIDELLGLVCKFTGASALILAHPNGSTLTFFPPDLPTHEAAVSAVLAYLLTLPEVTAWETDDPDVSGPAVVGMDHDQGFVVSVRRARQHEHACPTSDETSWLRLRALAYLRAGGYDPRLIRLDTACVCVDDTEGELSISYRQDAA
jgi:hypothetical protein